MLNEGISDNHGHGFWFDHRGAYLARLCGRTAFGERPGVYCSYVRRRGAVSLGVALARPIFSPVVVMAAGNLRQKAGVPQINAINPINQFNPSLPDFSAGFSASFCYAAGSLVLK